LGTKNIEIGGILANILTITLPLPLLLPVVILHRPLLYKVTC